MLQIQAGEVAMVKGDSLAGVLSSSMPDEASAVGGERSGNLIAGARGPAARWAVVLGRRPTNGALAIEITFVFCGLLSTCLDY